MSGDLTYQQILGRLAPCGMDCQRCVMCADGIVQRLASELSVALEGFDKMAARMADRAAALAGYEKFQEILGLLTEVTCSGCRAGGASLPFCAARTCFREHGVDYCFQCEDYPCTHNDYPEALDRRWRAINDRMSEVGVEEYYRESLLKPRYE